MTRFNIATDVEPVICTIVFSTAGDELTDIEIDVRRLPYVRRSYLEGDTLVFDISEQTPDDNSRRELTDLMKKHGRQDGIISLNRQTKLQIVFDSALDKATAERLVKALRALHEVEYAGYFLMGTGKLNLRLSCPLPKNYESKIQEIIARTLNAS